jgi:hypothetical protein
MRNSRCDSTRSTFDVATIEAFVAFVIFVAFVVPPRPCTNPPAS